MQEREKDWVNIMFFTLTPIIGVAVTASYTWRVGFQWWMLILLLALYVLAGVSITAGYHRFFSHKSYNCSRVAQAFFAFFGAFAAQHSILWWAAGHRLHHRHVDTDWDPYNIKRGFWWAHIFWIFYKSPSDGFDNVADLYENRIVTWQHRWHQVIMIVGGFGIPIVVGYLCGDWIAGLLWGGFARLVLLHQSTFFVNSLAHSAGQRTYNAGVSARDNWFVALLTFGEGYHSFHHRFPSDFRNGIRWYHWDPGKWLIRILHGIGLASDLRRVPPPQIEQARMRAALRVVEPRLVSVTHPAADEIRKRINAAVENLEHAFALWRQHIEERAAGLTGMWRQTRRKARQRVRDSRRQWKDAMRMLARLPEVA